MSNVREYDTNKHLSVANRVVLVTIAALALAMTLGYQMCFEVIRGEIWWSIVALCCIVMVYGLFGGRSHDQVRVAPLPEESEPIPAYPSGVLNGESLMNYNGQPFNFVDYDPTQPDPVRVLGPAT